jgi:O-antigen/teichoic acid export membrane protein
MSRQRNRRIVFASGVGLAQRAAQLLTTLITLPLVLHALGLAGFGVWGAATSLGWLSGMLDLGLGSALITLLPASLAANRPDQARAQVAAALYGGIGMTLLVIAGGAACLGAGAQLPSPPFVLAGIALALNIPLSISRGIWFGLQKAYAASIWDSVQTFLTLGLLLAAAWAQAGVTAMVAAVYLALLATNLASLTHALARHPALRPALALRTIPFRAVFNTGGMMFALTLASICAYGFDNLMALDWLGAAAAAQMAIALRVCTTAFGFLDVISLPLWPAFVEAAAQNDRRWLRRTLLGGTLGLAGLSLAGAGTLAAFGAPVLRWWLHQDLHFSHSFLWVMAAWIVMLALPRAAALLLNAVLALRVQALILGASAIAGFIAKYFAAQAFGAPGILGVTPALWLCLVTPSLIWLAWRRARTV